MKKIAILFGFVAIFALVIGGVKFSIGLSAIARGYKCHEDGLTLDQCQRIQKDRWDAFGHGVKEIDLPAFTKP